MQPTIEVLKGVPLRVGDKVIVTQVYEFGLKHYLWTDDDAQQRALEFADELVRQYFDSGVSVVPVYAECSGEILEVWGVNHQFELTAVVRVVEFFDLKPADAAPEELQAAMQWAVVVQISIIAASVGAALWGGYMLQDRNVEIARLLGPEFADTVKTIGVVIAVVALVFLLSKVL